MAGLRRETRSPIQAPGSFHILSAAGFAAALFLWFVLRGGIAAQREHVTNRPHQPWGALFQNAMAWKLTGIWSFASLLYIGILAFYAVQPAGTP